MGAGHARHVGHSHEAAPAASPRVRHALAAVVLPLVVATIVALVVLWPESAPPIGSEDTVHRNGTVTAITEQPCPDVAEQSSGPCVTVRLDDGTSVEARIPQGPGAPEVSIGDNVVLTAEPDPADPAVIRYSLVDHQRGRPLALLVLLASAVIIGFGRWRGLAALAGLAISFGILLTFVLPGIRAGQPPLLMAVVGSAAIMFSVLYLTHGVSVQTSVAVLGTLVSLVITGVLGVFATSATHLTGFGDEEASRVATLLEGVDPRGLLLAGIIIGSLGVLDDVTVTQSATVTELAAANPTMTRRGLYRSATRIGRAHIASTVNTIVLAYAGASLPLLLLVVASGNRVGTVLTSEFIAQEIVRSAVGTMGLVAAVPITTALAALVTAGAYAQEAGSAAADVAPAEA
jgi:uncharacterized membrane protein